MSLIYFGVSLLSAFIGAISGIGGGVIIKPVMDAIGTMSVSTISFLSGCTVLTMAIVSMIRNLSSNKGVSINFGITLYLAIGSSIGGVLGKRSFDVFRDIIGNDNLIGSIQAMILLAINVAIIIYIKNKARIKTLKVKSKTICIIIGLILGVISSFLGIGGGPLNIAVLYYFLSMAPKETAINSLFIILCSQITSLSSTFISWTIPEFSVVTLVVMCIGGVSGALIGSHQSKKMDDEMIEKFFSIVLYILIFINVVNIVKFSMM